MEDNGEVHAIATKNKTSEEILRLNYAYIKDPEAEEHVEVRRLMRMWNGSNLQEEARLRSTLLWRNFYLVPAIPSGS